VRSRPAERGAHATFAADVERLADRLYGTALRLTRNPEDAEDLVAETVAKAWASLDGLRDRERFDSWILRILNNTFVSDWRSRRARPEVLIESNEDEAAEDTFSFFEQLHQPFLLWWSNPEESAIAEFLRRDVAKALEELEDAYRVVVVFVDVEGYSYAEAAEMLGVPVGTVRSRLHRARAMLQRRLWKHAQDARLVDSGHFDDPHAKE
jgi:RNA polymerase sigma factor (sigma-70 family)